MGKAEKIVVFSILIFVVVLFSWSLGGSGTKQAAERERSYGDGPATADAGVERFADGENGGTERLRRESSANRNEGASSGSLSHREGDSPGSADSGGEAPWNAGREAPGEGSGSGGEAFALPDYARGEEGRGDGDEYEHGGGLERGGPSSSSREVRMRPGWDLVTTAGLEATVNPDLLVYEVMPGDSWRSIARDLYGQESKAALLRHNNEGLDEPVGSINVPARDELGALGEARIVEVLRGETLWGVAERTLGSGTRWRAIYDANQDVVPNPDRIAAGTVLTIPADTEVR